MDKKWTELKKLIEQKNIALKIVAKSGVIVVVDNDALITAYNVDSFNKY